MTGPQRNRQRGLTALGTVLAILGADLAHAQQGASSLLSGNALPSDTPLVIVADRMSYDTSGRIARAEGAAEAFYGQRALGADTLVYDAQNGRVSASGAVVLSNDDGSYLFADEATLDVGLENGAISAPKVLLPGGGRLSAAEGARVEDRYTVLGKVVYSPCDVCEADPTPLWRIRADRVVHDEVAQDIFYEDATFDVEGLSVFYLPYFRHPDPSVERRTGFLAPKVSRSDTAGFAVKTPYYIELAPNRDLTVTPFITSDDGPLLELEYRARTETGQYELWGSFTRNDVRKGEEEWRSALRGQGVFALDDDWRWGFDIDYASDDTFLRRYDYSDADRVDSRAWVGQQSERVFAEANLYYFQSFRANEPDALIPQALPEFRYENRLIEDPALGVASVAASGVHLERGSGRDISRASASANWERQFVTDAGLVLTPYADVRADAYLISDDPGFSEDLQARATGALGLDVRMPFVAENALGTHLVEPIVQLVASPSGNDFLDIPNEDSLDIEFDETNLFERSSRFPGRDRYENGSRLNAGVRYAYTHESGLALEATYGRVFRASENTDFSPFGGLREEGSDHVGALRLKLTPHLDVTHRVRLDSETLEINRNELYARGRYGRVGAALDYVYVGADPFAGFDEDREEVGGSVDVRLSETLRAYGGARHDLIDSRFVSAGGGLRFENECCSVDFTLDRRFNDDRDAEETTNFGLEVRLKTFGS